MGLDMYLMAEKHVSGYELSSAKERDLYSGACELFEAEKFKDPHTPSLTVSIIVGYWRKANAIHAWFVKNVQDANDDCGCHWVGDDILNELLKVCKEVLADTSKAETLLPPQSGFFFGSTEIDERYIKDIEHTVEIIEKLKTNLPKEWKLYYRSSW